MASRRCNHTSGISKLTLSSLVQLCQILRANMLPGAALDTLYSYYTQTNYSRSLHNSH